MSWVTILLRGDKLADSPTVTPTMLANTLVYKEKFQTTFFSLDSSEDFVPKKKRKKKKTHTSTI